MTVLPECGAHILAAHLPEPDIGRAGWNRGPYAVARSGHLALHRSWLLFASALAVSLLGFPPDKAECKSEISLAMIMRRSEERRVGKGCLRKCKYRWWPYH